MNETQNLISEITALKPEAIKKGFDWPTAEQPCAGLSAEELKEVLAEIKEFIKNQLTKRKTMRRRTKEVEEQETDLFQEVIGDRMNPLAQLRSACDLSRGEFVTRSGRVFLLRPQIAKAIMFQMLGMKPARRQEISLAMYNDSQVAYDVLSQFYDFQANEVYQDNSRRG